MALAKSLDPRDSLMHLTSFQQIVYDDPIPKAGVLFDKEIPQRYFRRKDKYVVMNGQKEFIYLDGKKIEIERTAKKAYPVYGEFNVRTQLIAVDDKMQENNHGKIGKRFQLVDFVTDAQPENKTLNTAVKDPITKSDTVYYARDEFNEDVEKEALKNGKMIRPVIPVKVENKFYDSGPLAMMEEGLEIVRDTSKESEKRYFTEKISVPNLGKINDLEIKPVLSEKGGARPFPGYNPAAPF
jgi:hypothetical protein